MKGFDKHLHELLEAHPEAALEHARLFAGLPISTQLAIMRRRKLSQRAVAKEIKVPQLHVARTNVPRIFSMIRASLPWSVRPKHSAAMFSSFPMRN